MKIILRVLKYILRYKKALVLSILLGFVASLLNIFNIFAFKPILDVMFAGSPSVGSHSVAASVEKEKPALIIAELSAETSLDTLAINCPMLRFPKNGRSILRMCS